MSSDLLLLALRGVGRTAVVIAVARVLASMTDAELDKLPTQREIALRADITEHSVRRALDRLEELGLVTREIAARNRRRLRLDREGLEVVARLG